MSILNYAPTLSHTHPHPNTHTHIHTSNIPLPPTLISYLPTLISYPPTNTSITPIPPPHTHTHTPTLLPHTPWKEERRRVGERARPGTATPPCTLDEVHAHLNPSRERNGAIMTARQTQNSTHCIHTRPFLTHYGTWTTPTLPTPSMEYPLQTTAWNMDMEYGPLPTPIKEYRLLLIASIKLRTNPNPSICVQVSLELFHHSMCSRQLCMYMSMLSVFPQDRRRKSLNYGRQWQ